MINIIKTIKIAIISMTIIGLSILTLFFYILWKFSPQLPSYDKILNYKPNLSSRIYSADGLLLKSFYLQERIFIPIDRIPNENEHIFLNIGHIIIKKATARRIEQIQIFINQSD